MTVNREDLSVLVHRRTFREHTVDPFAANLILNQQGGIEEKNQFSQLLIGRFDFLIREIIYVGK